MYQVRYEFSPDRYWNARFPTHQDAADYYVMRIEMYPWLKCEKPLYIKSVPFKPSMFTEIKEDANL